MTLNEWAGDCLRRALGDLFLGPYSGSLKFTSRCLQRMGCPMTLNEWKLATACSDQSPGA